MKKILISELFSKKVLTKSEAKWVRDFYEKTGKKPIGTHEVTDEGSFKRMVESNAL